MAEKFLIASGKGGVGKSTVTSFLAKAFEQDGKSVLAIDADTGLGALDVMFGVSDKKLNTWGDVMNGCDLKNAVIKVSEKLHLLASPAFLPDDIPEDVFVKIAFDAEKDYDVVLFDAPAGIDDSLKRAAKAADRAIFIATADEISVKCAAAVAEKAKDYGIAPSDMRLIVNRFVKKAALKQRLLNIDGVIDKSGVMLLGILPEDKKIPYSSVTGIFPDKKSRFVKAVNRVYSRINGSSIPLKL